MNRGCGMDKVACSRPRWTLVAQDEAAIALTSALLGLARSKRVAVFLIAGRHEGPAPAKQPRRTFGRRAPSISRGGTRRRESILRRRARRRKRAKIGRQ